MPSSPLHIVRASAGSGKTHALTGRFVEMLLGASHDKATALCGHAQRQGYAPNEVLAVTFTNAAADEMRSRVIGRLKKTALSSPPSEHGGKAKRLLGQVLRHFQDLNVRTIESLLSRLVRIFALELGLPPDFEVSFESRSFFDELYDGLCAQIPADDELRELFEQAFTRRLLWLDKGSFMPGLVLRESMAKVFDAVLLSGVAPVPIAALDGALTDTLNQTKGLARRIQDELLSLKVELPKHFKTFLGKILDCEQFDLYILDSAYAQRTNIRACFPPKSRYSGQLEQHQARLDPLVLKLSQSLQLTGDLFRACCLAPQAHLAARLREPFFELCRQRGLSLSKLWPKALAGQLDGENGVPDAYCRLGARLEHIFVDEFQDTSRDQWDILSPLAEEPLSRGGSLYLVGDPKQAIYGWRGGDAKLMTDAASAFASVSKADLDHLPHNWRSKKAIIDFNNRVFSALEDEDLAADVLDVLLPEKCPETDKQAAKTTLLSSFARSSQGIPEGRNEPGGAVRVVRVAATDKTEYVQAALDALVADILAAQADGAPLESMAVLTRTNDQSEDIASRLLAQGVPTITENSLRLAGHPRIEAIMALLAFLDYPADDTAFFGFVSSKDLFGSASQLSEASLRDWLCGCPKGRPVYLAFQDAYRKQYQDIIVPFFARAGLCSPYDLVAEIIDAFELRRRFEGDDPFLDRLLELAHEAGRQTTPSLSALLELWRDKGAQERLPKPEGTKAVSVMTAHRAKGLQFPRVFHPLLRESRNRGEQLEDVAIPLCLTGHNACADPNTLNPQLTSRLEELNLLYVAWTRAEDELSIYLPPEKADLLGKRGLIKAVDLLLDGLEEQGLCTQIEGQKLPAPQLERDETDTSKQQFTRELPLPRPLDWLPGLRVRKTDLAQLGDLSERDQAKMRGTLMHRAAELLLRSRGRLSGVQALSAALGEKGKAMTEHFDATAQADMTATLDWLCASEPLRGLLADEDVSILPEADLIAAQGELIRPDAVFVGADTLLCLDFKTGQAHDDHHKQLGRYVRELEALRVSGALAAQSTAQGLLVYLDARHLTPVQGAAS